MKEKYCQSCGMPMQDSDQLYGTNADGTKNTDYCNYCYEYGKFTQNISMEEMIEICIPHVISFNPQMTDDSAREMMNEFFPTLKRWQK